ncbi:hypothetical protein Aduo_018708 [Ancylostoma duodenale]
MDLELGLSFRLAKNGHASQFVLIFAKDGIKLVSRARLEREMPSYHHICALVNSNTTTDWPRELRDNSRDAPTSNLNRITYAYIAPVIIVCGILGDVLTVVTLTHPLLRKSTIVYTYLTLLAMTDLLTHFSVIPMIMWLLDIRACSAAASFFYAHIGFPLVTIDFSFSIPLDLLPLSSNQ